MKKSCCESYFKMIRGLPAWIALGLLCSGCHYDSHPDVDEARESNLQADLGVIYEGIPEITAPLTLEDIFEFADQRNLNVLVKELEYEIQTELVTRERFGMLPDIKSHFERLIRNRNTGSSSQSLVPGVPPAPLSISSQKHQRRWDWAIVWNYVDFGLAFLRSRQEYNRALKVQFEYQRLKQNLYVDITREYWKAQTAKLARNKSKIILEKAKTQQEATKKQLEAQIISEIQGLRNEGQLIAYQAQFQFYDKEYHTALSELGLLMGFPPFVQYELADVASFGIDVDLGDICELEMLALYYRPELYGDDAEEMIQLDEARAAVLQLYPGVDLFAGHNYDSNKFLLFNHWIQAGARAAYNLLDWPRHLQESRAAGGRILLARNNRVLMSVSILTQVHLAHSVYLDNLESYKLANDILSINERLVKAARSEQKEGKLHEADVLKYEIELLQSQIDTLKQYGEVENALEQLNNSMGIPRHFVNTITYGSVKGEELKAKEAENPKDAGVETDELRNIYLDYIIDKIEKAEEQLQHQKVEGEEKEIERKARQEEGRAETFDQSLAPSNEDPSTAVSDQESEQLKEDDQDSRLPEGQISISDQDQEDIDQLVKKYDDGEESDDVSEADLNELIKKYDGA